MTRKLEAICADCGREGKVLLEEQGRTMLRVLCAADYLERRQVVLHPVISAHAAGARTSPDRRAP